jgi:hypothetical protein
LTDAEMDEVAAGVLIIIDNFGRGNDGTVFIRNNPANGATVARKGVVMRLELGEMYRKAREVIQPALAMLLLLFSLAAEGQSGLGPNERVSGPALVGPVTIMQVVNTTNANFVFAGHCKGNPAPFSITLSPFDVAAATTAASLEGLRLPRQGPAGCLSQAGGEDVIVVTVVTPKFVNTVAGLILAEVVILYVVSQ